MKLLVQDQLNLNNYDYNIPSIKVEVVAFSGLVFSEECCYITLDTIIENKSMIRIGFCLLYEFDSEKEEMEILYGNRSETGIGKFANVPKVLAISHFIKMRRNSFELWCNSQIMDDYEPNYLKFNFTLSQFIMIMDLINNILSMQPIEYDCMDKFRFLDSTKYTTRYIYDFNNYFDIAINNIYIISKGLINKIIQNNYDSIINLTLYRGPMRYCDLVLALKLSKELYKSIDKNIIIKNSKDIISEESYYNLYSIPVDYKYRELDGDIVESIITINTSYNDVKVLIFSKDDYYIFKDKILEKLN